MELSQTRTAAEAKAKAKAAEAWARAVKAAEAKAKAAEAADAKAAEAKAKAAEAKAAEVAEAKAAEVKGLAQSGQTNWNKFKNGLDIGFIGESLEHIQSHHVRNITSHVDDPPLSNNLPPNTPLTPPPSTH